MKKFVSAVLSAAAAAAKCSENNLWRMRPTQ